MTSLVHLLTALTLAATAAFPVWAYQKQDLAQLLKQQQTPTGPRHSLDLEAVDGVIRALTPHASQYPPHFSNTQEAQAARADAEALSNMLDLLTKGGATDWPLLLLTARLNTLAHNLDVPGAATRADAAFRALLRQQPRHAGVNLGFGVFLAESNRSRESIGHLQTALDEGLPQAHFTLGMVRMTLGQSKEAVRHLEQYRARFPADPRTDEIIAAIRQNKVSVKTMPSPGAR